MKITKKVMKKTENVKETKKEQDPELPQVKEGTVREVVKGEGLKFIDKVKLKLKPTKSYLVTMHFSNGTCKNFIIASNSELFTYKKRTYYLRYENSWFDLSFNLYRLNFFDDFPVPIDREVVKNGDSKFFSVTPENIKPLLKMEYVRALASSQEISKYLKMTIFLCAVCLLGIVIVGILVYTKVGSVA